MSASKALIADCRVSGVGCVAEASGVMISFSRAWRKECSLAEMFRCDGS